jgi:hypothetical protein
MRDWLRETPVLLLARFKLLDHVIRNVNGERLTEETLLKETESL